MGFEVYTLWKSEPILYVSQAKEDFFRFILSYLKRNEKKEYYYVGSSKDFDNYLSLNNLIKRSSRYAIHEDKKKDTFYFLDYAHRHLENPEIISEIIYTLTLDYPCIIHITPDFYINNKRRFTPVGRFLGTMHECYQKELDKYK